LVQHTKTGKIYQTAQKYTKLPKNIPKCHKTYEMAVKYTKCQNFSLQDTPKYTQIGIFGLKIYHLATLVGTRWVFASHYFHRQKGFYLHSRQSCQKGYFSN
jgi:hypothetical protein